MLFQLHMKSFRTRVARRVFILFIICALVPVSVLATVSYWTVRDQLASQSRERLHQDCKTLSVSFYERLLFFRSELQSIASVFQAQLTSGISEGEQRGISLQVRTHFTSVGLLSEEGWQQITGDRIEPPNPNLVQKEWLADNNALLLIDRRDNQLQLFMLLQMPAEDGTPAYLAGKIKQGYIWEAAEGRPPETELILIDRSAGLFYSSFSDNPFLGENPLVIGENHHRGQTEWTYKEQNYLVSFTSIYLKSNFFNPDWVVVLIEPYEHIFAPMESFRISFPILIVIAVALVFILSLTLIHKSLTPIEELRRGTEKIADGEFGYQVDITSGDEFESLGNAFNEMSDRLKEGQLLLARSSKLATVGQMSSGVVHELQQPLAGMDGMVQLLQMNDELSDGNRKKLEHIKQDLERVEKILGRFASSDQVSEERMRPLGLPKLIDDVHAMLENQFTTNRIDYTADHQKGLPLVHGHAQELEQVFSNLMINAIHALESRGIGERQLTVKTYQWGGKVMVDIIDNGCGMPKRMQARVFDPFFTTKDTEKGAGIGMTIVESALHNHGATINLESTVNVGTHITINFPVDIPKESMDDTQQA